MTMSEPIPLDESIHELQAQIRAMLDIRQSKHERIEAESKELEQIRQARAVGVTWEQIGAMYGITRQGAEQRFKRHMGG